MDSKPKKTDDPYADRNVTIKVFAPYIVETNGSMNGMRSVATWSYPVRELRSLGKELEQNVKFKLRKPFYISPLGFAVEGIFALLLVISVVTLLVRLRNR